VPVSSPHNAPEGPALTPAAQGVPKNPFWRWQNAVVHKAPASASNQARIKIYPELRLN
jgi:hypothetical protein